jgi:hypothetical protein
LKLLGLFKGWINLVDSINLRNNRFFFNKIKKKTTKWIFPFLIPVEWVGEALK